MRPEQRAFADGGKPAAAHVSPGSVCEIGRRKEGRARSVRGRGDGRTGPGYLKPQADHVRGAGGLGRAQFRPDHHTLPRGAPQGAGPDAHARGRGGILADPRSDRHRGQPRAEAGSLPRGLRQSLAAHPQAFFESVGGERVMTLFGRPRESGDPYAVTVRFEAAAVAAFFQATTAGGYGSLLSQGRRYWKHLRMGPREGGCGGWPQRKRMRLAVVVAASFAIIPAGGYGSLLSQGRR